MVQSDGSVREEGQPYSYRRIRTTYVAALALIAASLLVFAVAMFTYISTQKDDALIVNVSGRQRMLSQRLFKNLLLLMNEPDREERHALRREIDDLRGQLVLAQEFLGAKSRSKESESVQRMLQEQNPHYLRMVHAYSLVALPEYISSGTLLPAVAIMRVNEPRFLQLQENITDRFQHEADTRLQRLWLIATGSFIALFLLLVAEWSFVFRPMAGQIDRYVDSLTRTHRDMAAAIAEKNLSQVNLRRLLSASPDLTFVFDERGVYIDIFTSSEHLLFRDRDALLGARLHDIFAKEQADFFLSMIEKTLQRLEPTHATYTLALPSGEATFRATATFVENADTNRHVVMFVRDVTNEVAAERDKKEQQQKLLHTIIETQEKERARIAADMHDGIGQMFAVLKLNVASLRNEPEDDGFDDVLESIDTIVAELRGIAWNLMPASLGRFGLETTLASETDLLTQRFGITTRFHSSNLSDRYPEAVEVCVYRVAQELLANIVRHSSATEAEVILCEADGSLTMEVRDYGRGFSPQDPPAGSGRGLIGIQSRLLALGGDVRVTTSIGGGTKVRISIPLGGDNGQEIGHRQYNENNHARGTNGEADRRK